MILLLGSVAFFLKEFLPSSVAMIFNPESYGSDAERNSLGDRMLAINAERNSLGDRMLAINAGIVAFLDRPVFGYGLESLVNHPLNLHNQMSHNTFIEILAETGVVGLVLYGGAFISVLRLSYLYLKNVDVYFFDKIVVAFFAFNIMSLTLALYYSRILFFVFALMIVISKGIESERNDVSC
ncbi:O-antigen ligase family protein [Motilimonas sp. 1_MG-2023]|uniref:O-antigen ligase family protein n=1 Tax=Motilimonas sp. 1_MG-2023 TaxID=3062672 RepID=UPI0026E21F89|nr:O-antigen ligase family protein [Motilimonas sp. 1_MG-2023]MDO6527444.1 O-antigen ligase family protein [Motilimonas sp. 1_MG-2023]